LADRQLLQAPTVGIILFSLQKKFFDMFELALSILVSYLIGSLNSSLILGKINNYDVREHGSGNAGATNTYRMHGRIHGTIVFCFDCFKGFFAIILAESLILSGLDNPLFDIEIYLYFSALSVVIGHCYPLWFQFKGGKGAATGLGIFLYFEPFLVAPSLLIWMLSLVVFRFVGLATILAFASLPVFVFLFERQSFVNLVFFSFILGLLILFTHRQNINSMLKGTEHRVSFSLKSDAN
jgi:glycerol-3-phosphate acyltransferase PlsY|tara:strand:- start:1222 stop:1935 length:714 start_codon:yes stop_codon:yes gene_type:complete